MAHRHDIIVEQGATLLLEVDCQDENGSPCDLTGCSAAAQVRVRYADPDPAAVLTAEVSPLSGRVTLTLSAEQTRALSKPYGVWDLRLNWPDAMVQRLVEGKVTVKPEVTR